MDERIIAKKLDILSRRVTISQQPIEGWQVRLADYRGPEEYVYEGDWEPLAPYAAFPALKTVFLRAQVQCPAPATPSGQVHVQFEMSGLEGLLTVDGRPYAGLDSNHLRIAAPAPGRHALGVEFVTLLRAYCQPELLNDRALFRGSALVEIDTELEAAYYDLQFAWEATRVVRDARRQQRLEAALEEALLQIDLTLSQEALREDVARARALLAERLRDIAPDPEGGRVYLVGHTHIDTAWLWPLKETVRKCARTFSTAVRLMERYPDFYFACSQAQLYAYVKAYYPSLYEDIRRWVAAGRWLTTGAMWVESDCNVPSGESLIRQFMYGLEFYAREFGTRPQSCWLPDVFGYPASLPQILKGCGIPYFFTCKLHWQSTNPFPHHLFWWEGIDGSRVLAHIPKLRNNYNGYPNPEQLTIAWNDYLEKGIHDEVMLPFGYGDGGGGVTSGMLEFVDRAGAFPGLPATRTGGEEAFFEDALRRAGQELPMWEGELYLETHRGTYTSQSRTKQANRFSERALREAEVWGSIANLRGAAISLAPLRDAWQRLLTQQFHDILPGSSIGPVYEDALADLQTVQDVAQGLRDRALEWLQARADGGGDLCVFNALSWPRSDPVEGVVRDPGSPFHLVDVEGHACPVQVLSREGDYLRVLFEPRSVPSMGWAWFRVEPGEVDEPPLAVSETHLENAFFSIELDGNGQIASLLDKRRNRQVVAHGEQANRWQLFQDGPEREAAWNVHDTFAKRQYPLTGRARISVVERGPVRVSVRVEHAYRDSHFQYDILLYRRTPRVDFVADVDWQERQTMLKVAFPVAVRSTQATYEVQFGAVQRSTRQNTLWEQQQFEVSAQRWADLSEAGYGVSLLNDSRYGYDVKGSVLRLTLLRGPEYPDPEADRGRHQFAYALFPHPGSWDEAGTVRQACELNEPMIAVPAERGGRSLPAAHAAVEVEGQGIVLETLKPAEDGDGWILRLYEAHGGRGPVKVRFDRGLARALACNLVEEPGEPVQVSGNVLALDVGPFEIKSYRVWFRG